MGGNDVHENGNFDAGSKLERESRQRLELSEEVSIVLAATSPLQSNFLDLFVEQGGRQHGFGNDRLGGRDGIRGLGGIESGQGLLFLAGFGPGILVLDNLDFRDGILLERTGASLELRVGSRFFIVFLLEEHNVPPDAKEEAFKKGAEKER